MDNRDPAVDGLGIEITHHDDGRVSARVGVTNEMLNSHGVCHGGIIFLLADTVMDYATNGPLEADITAFAAHAEVDYVRAGRSGDTLTAMGAIRDSWGRTNLVDITVTNQDDEAVAHFRGRTRAVKAASPDRKGS